MKALKIFRFWLYAVYFTIEIDANTLVAQLNQSATDRPDALVSRWLAWIRLFDFDVLHVPGTKHSAADGLSRHPYSPAEKNEGASEQDLGDFIEADLEVFSIYGTHKSSLTELQSSSILLTSCNPVSRPDTVASCLCALL